MGFHGSILGRVKLPNPKPRGPQPRHLSRSAEIDQWGVNGTRPGDARR